MDAILGLLNNPVVLTLITVLWGLLVKFHPAFAKVPNALIPYFNAIIALLIKLGGPTVAHAQGVAAPVVAGCLWCTLGSAAWQAIMSSLVYEVFLRNPFAKVLVKQPAPTG